jgi:folate-dependent phosphoribosylglycinamide formyltransferase PurN
MFKKLKQRWKVNNLNLFLVICTFAIGGSLCGWVGRKILLFTGLEKNGLWFFLYILLITLLWPVCVLLLSIPLGQFRFFRNYIAKIFRRLGNGKSTSTQVAIFASGAGTNAANLIRYFKELPEVAIKVIVCNHAEAGVMQIAGDHHINTMLINKKILDDPKGCLLQLQQQGIQFIILAGFLLKIPPPIVEAYRDKIINIHPALLPKYGGKGMYGHFVHEAVIANGEKESGISIHLVDDHYDHGKLLFQATCVVTENDDALTLAKKIHALEQQHFPLVVNEYLKKQNQR